MWASSTNEQVLDFLKALERIAPLIEASGRKKGYLMRVTIDDGTIIDHKVVAATFIETLERFGIEEVLALGRGGDKQPLIRRKDPSDSPGQDRKSDSSGHYRFYNIGPILPS